MSDDAAPAPNNDDWLSNPAPPPRAVGAPAHQVAPKAPKPARKPAGKVTPLRPLEALGEALDDAPEAGAAGAATPAADAPRQPEGTGPELPPAEPGGPSSRAGRPKGEIWGGCPVRVLGKRGTTCYYLDTRSQLIGISRHDQQALMTLFGNRIEALCWHFPQWEKPEAGKSPVRKKHRFDAVTAAMAMNEAADDKGIFDPDNAVRGVGAWADDDGQLVYHLGDRVLVGSQELPPDLHQGRIYPAFPPIPHPAPADKDADPSTILLDTLATWQWSRPDLDPMIALGLIGVQMFGGALDWRPAYWVTGGPGSGKSAFQKLMLHLHGGEKGLVQSTDPTARGIAALLGQSTLPVALDELEPGDQGSTKERDIIVTARVAASGGRWVRGSSDQKGATGQLRSTFLFSSILVPGVLKSQDLQRIILLTLNPFAEGSKPPDLRADTWRKRGAQIKRLVIDRWPSWARRLDLWREALADYGIHGRDADNWATTIAMAQMIQSEAMPGADELAGWAKKLARHVKAAQGEVSTDADEVLTHLLSQYFDPFRRGNQWTIAQWLMVAAAQPGAPEALQNACSAGATDGGLIAEIAAKGANAQLAPIMLRVVREKDQEPRLFVGNKHVQGLLNLFRETQWQGGAWSQSLGRVKGAQPSAVPRTLAGLTSRGWEIPFSAIPGLMAFPQDRAPEAPAEATTVQDLGDTY